MPLRSGRHYLLGHVFSNAADDSDADEMRCVNADVCGSRRWPNNIPNTNVDKSGQHEETCMSCGSWFKCSNLGFDRLDISHQLQNCVVCLQNRPSVKFPQCAHRACFQCFKYIFFWDESLYHVNPCMYGAPSCPNGCSNPDRGRQCYCDEYDTVLQEWKETMPLDYEMYNRAENISIETSDSAGVNGSRKCPVCRSIYNINFNQIN